MKITGFVLSLVGFVGLLSAAMLEISIGSDLERLINYGLMSYVLAHRMLMVMVAGFVFVAGAILYGLAVTQQAIVAQTEVIREAINAPDVCPAASLLHTTPTSPIQSASVRSLARTRKMTPGGVSPDRTDTSDGVVA